MNEKEEIRIKTFVDRKENSITEAAIRRDSALFCATRMGTWKSVERSTMLEELNYWEGFFRRKYSSRS